MLLTPRELPAPECIIHAKCSFALVYLTKSYYNFLELKRSSNLLFKLFNVLHQNEIDLLQNFILLTIDFPIVSRKAVRN